MKQEQKVSEEETEQLISLLKRVGYNAAGK
jgi:hypothetical protein